MFSTLFREGSHHILLGCVVIVGLLLDIEVTPGGKFEGVHVDVAGLRLSRRLNNGVDATRQLRPAFEEPSLAQSRWTRLLVFP